MRLGPSTPEVRGLVRGWVAPAAAWALAWGATVAISRVYALDAVLQELPFLFALTAVPLGLVLTGALRDLGSPEGLRRTAWVLPLAVPLTASMVVGRAVDNARYVPFHVPPASRAWDLWWLALDTGEGEGAR